MNNNGSANIVGFAAERYCATDGNYRKTQLRPLPRWIYLLVVVRGTAIALRDPMIIAVLRVARFFLPCFAVVTSSFLALAYCSKIDEDWSKLVL